MDVVVEKLELGSLKLAVDTLHVLVQELRCIRGVRRYCASISPTCWEPHALAFELVNTL